MDYFAIAKCTPLLAKAQSTAYGGRRKERNDGIAIVSQSVHRVTVVRNPNTVHARKRTGTRTCPFSWWEVVDSNHRSRRRQIYSLMHLATLQTAQTLNFQPLVKAALKVLVELVTGIEPATC